MPTISIRPKPALLIRAVQQGDHPFWLPLWLGYNSFYDRTLTPEEAEVTWTRLMHGDGEIKALMAFDEQNGEAFGLAQYFYHTSTLNPAGSCYLQDLFVAPAARGLSVGHRLIAAVAAEAKAQGAAVLYWQTEEFNGPARRLYEKVAKRSPFIRYQMEL